MAANSERGGGGRSSSESTGVDRSDGFMLDEVDEGRYGRRRDPVSERGERSLMDGLNALFCPWGVWGEEGPSVAERGELEGVKRSGNVGGGKGISGRSKFGWGWTNACWTYLAWMKVSRSDLHKGSF